MQNVRGLPKHESPYLILISPSAIYRPNANPKKLHKGTATEPQLAAWGQGGASHSHIIQRGNKSLMNTW